MPLPLLATLAAALISVPQQAFADSPNDAATATSPRLFEMPVADVVGPYQASLSYDGSLLEEPGILSSAGVAALGIGDLAQVEYRHTSAIGVRGGNVPLPAVGVQFKLPFAQKSRIPAIALAYRLGVEHVETLRGIEYLEKATDVYLVSRIALPASINVHLGGVFWDASMTDVNSEEEVLLHDTGTKRQIRPFGGIEAEPIKNAQLLVDLYWVPLFSPYADSAKDAIKLTPTLSWGVRYHLSKKISFESGVRVPDIGEANLLDAQIFGQLSIASDKIRRALDAYK